jgi:repressor LexA
MSDTRTSILNFIRDFLDRRGYAPTIRDIRKGCSISTTSLVQYHLNALEKQGHIRRDPQVFRSLQLVEKRGPGVPLLGTIAAGEPIPVPDSDSWTSAPTETINLPPDIVGDKSNLYALRVKGTSMIDALIDDGDIVVMQHQQSATDGEMVAVWLRDKQEVTLKRIYLERKRIRLQPANQQMDPIYSKSEDVEVQGRVVAVLRKLNQ